NWNQRRRPRLWPHYSRRNEMKLQPFAVYNTAPKTAEIVIYNDIGRDWFIEGITSESIKSKLDALGDLDEIHVRINSPGGDGFEGNGIYNILHQHPAKVTTFVD